RLAEAELATAAVVDAIRTLSARLALCRIVDRIDRALRRQEDVDPPAIGQRRLAAPEAIAAVRRELGAEVDACLALLGRAVVEIRIVRALGRAGVGRVALELPLALVVALAAVAVEEAILLARVDIVARNSGRERALVVVGRSGTFRIVRVDLSVHVVVDAVGALGRAAARTAVG